jgi:hypothetical protein
MKKEAKKMHDGNDRKYNNSNGGKRFHVFSPSYKLRVVEKVICDSIIRHARESGHPEHPEPLDSRLRGNDA